MVILTGQGREAFCSGGDQRVRGDGRLRRRGGTPRLNVLDLQRQIRTLPKPVVAMVAGYAIGGGHVLHLVCDLTIAADNARLRADRSQGRQLRRRVRRVVPGAHRRAEEGARDLVPLPPVRRARRRSRWASSTRVVPLEQLEEETVQWCREILANSPLALRCLKAALNADCDGQAGLQELAGNATLLYYLTEEGQEGRNAYLEKRKPDFGKFKRLP